MRKALTCGAYPGMGTGDPDFYKAFCWRFWNLAAGRGWPDRRVLAAQRDGGERIGDIPEEDVPGGSGRRFDDEC